MGVRTASILVMTALLSLSYAAKKPVLNCSSTDLAHARTHADTLSESSIIRFFAALDSACLGQDIDYADFANEAVVQILVKRPPEFLSALDKQTDLVKHLVLRMVERPRDLPPPQIEALRSSIGEIQTKSSVKRRLLLALERASKARGEEE